MNYFEEKDFNIFSNAGKSRDTQLEAKYKSTLDKFKSLVDKTIKELGDCYGYSMDTSCLTTPGKHVTQTLIGYKWARIYMNNYQGLLNPDTGKNRIQNVFGLSISTNGLSIKVEKNDNQIKQKLTNEQNATLQEIHDKTKMDINNADEKTLVETIYQYITSHEDEYLENGTALGIYECIKKRNMNVFSNLILKSYNLILTGAPGTGKTYLAKKIAKSLAGDNYEMVQFHPSYDYSDFVEGLRPVKNAKEYIGFERKDGVFKAFCKKALVDYNNTENKDEAPKYVFIIDEINRGEISKIFGELFFSIDPGYRGTKGKIKTQYQNLVDKEYNENGNIIGDDVFKDGFFVPENVYIIGTMNDIDRSVESMDFAMRRRFAFKEIKATDRVDMWNDQNQLSSENIKLANSLMRSLNYAIEQIPGLTSAYHVGPSYFLKLKECNEEELWTNSLKGLLFEYLRGMPDADSWQSKLEKIYSEAKNNQFEGELQQTIADVIKNIMKS